MSGVGAFRGGEIGADTASASTHDVQTAAKGLWVPKTRSRAIARENGICPKQQRPSLRLHAKLRVGIRRPGRGC